MEAPQALYNQSATHFALPLYLRGETEVEARSSTIFDTTEMKRGMLGYFYRERPPVR